MGGAPNTGYAGEVADDYASDKACALVELLSSWELQAGQWEHGDVQAGSSGPVKLTER